METSCGSGIASSFPRTHLERRKRAGFLFVLPALLFFGSVYIAAARAVGDVLVLQDPARRREEFVGLGRTRRC